MTGRELVDYIIINHYDSCELVIQDDGKVTPVMDCAYEMADKALVIFPVFEEEEMENDDRQLGSDPQTSRNAPRSEGFREDGRWR